MSENFDFAIDNGDVKKDILHSKFTAEEGFLGGVIRKKRYKKPASHNRRVFGYNMCNSTAPPLRRKT